VDYEISEPGMRDDKKKFAVTRYRCTWLTHPCCINLHPNVNNKTETGGFIKQRGLKVNQCRDQ
jgi:hypothetical protein